jgi:hypothetical protein
MAAPRLYPELWLTIRKSSLGNPQPAIEIFFVDILGAPEAFAVSWCSPQRNHAAGVVGMTYG